MLRDVLKTQAGDLVDLAVVRADRQRLEDALVADGYLTARVAEPRVTFGEGRGVFITFAITQGPQFRIRDVRVTGAAASDAGVITIGVGEVADAARIALAREALTERLAARGAKRPVVAHIVPDVAAGVADVELSASH
jgi:outer membrane protein assembly factor BamA